MSTQFTMIVNKNELNFEVQRLEPMSQLNFLLKIISILAKGSASEATSKKIEALLHILLQTGVDSSNVNFSESDTPASVLSSAVIGAFAYLEDKDRDYIINTLLSTVTLHTKANISIQMTPKEANRIFSGLKDVLFLLKEVIQLNFRSSGSEKE